MSILERAQAAAPQPSLLERAKASEPEVGVLEKTGQVLATLAGKFNKGMVDTVNAPFVASKWLGEKVLGADPSEGFDLLGNHKAGNFLKEATSREIPKGEIPLVDMLGTGLEWGGGGVRKIANKTTDIGADLLMGLGAAAGEQAAGEKGEVAGGMAGALADILRGKMPSLSDAPTKAEKTAEKTAVKAEEFMTAQMLDPEAAVIALRENVAAGNKGTLLDLTGDIGLTGVEGTGGLTRGGQKALIDTQAIRDDQIVQELVAPFGTGQAGQAEEIAQGLTNARQQVIEKAGASRIAAREAEAAQGLVQTRAAAAADDAELVKVAAQQQEKAGVVAPTKATTEASEDTYNMLRAKEEAYEIATEKPAWKAFDESEPIKALGMQVSIDRVLKGLPDETQAAMKRGYGPELGDIDKWSGELDPKSFSAVRSNIKDKIAKSEKYGTTEKYMDEIVKAMDEHMASTGNKSYAAAVDATRLKHQKFRPNEVGKQRRKAAPETFLEKLRFTGDQGKVTAKNLKASESDDALAEVESYFNAKVQGEAVDDKFLKKYAGFLDEFPALKDEYTELAQANKGSDTATGLHKARAAQTQKQTKAYEKALEAASPDAIHKMDKLSTAAKTRITAQYADKPNATLRRLLGDRDSVGELATLRSSLTGKGAEGSLKGHVRDIVKEKLTSTKTGTPKARDNALESLHDMKSQLVDSGIVTAKEFDSMMGAAGRSADAKSLRKSMIERKMGKSDSEVNTLGASILSAAALSALPAGHSLLLGGAVQRRIKKLLRRDNYDVATMERVDEFLANPQSYADSLRTKVSQADFEDPEIFAAKLVDSFTKPKARISGQTVADDQE